MENAALSLITPLITGLIAGVISAISAYLIIRTRVRLDLIAEYDKELHTKRLEAYKELWKLLEPLAPYSPPAPVTYEVIRDMSQKMREWYFQRGGIFLSGESREPYFALKKSMRDVINSKLLLENKRVEIDVKSLFNLQKQGHDLRGKLAEDIGTRNISFAYKETKSQNSNNSYDY